MTVCLPVCVPPAFAGAGLKALTCGNVVGPVGLEPTTYGLKVRSSAN